MRFIYEPEMFFIMVGVRVCAFNNDDRHLFFFLRIMNATWRQTISK